MEKCNFLIYYTKSLKLLGEFLVFEVTFIRRDKNTHTVKMSGLESI